ncbi:ROK family protein [Streptomyces sp. NPDC088789]|uniref:ROK family protein n=1 Tax=Streptomyces sp. NPDC088789 TaxID=3365899 RepID=UPI00381A33D8
MGVDRIRAVIATSDRHIAQTEEWYTRPERGPDAVVDTLLGCAAELVASANRSGAQVSAVGVSVHGVVDEDSGVVEHGAALGWSHTPVRAWTEEHIGLPVVVAHSVHAAAVAECRVGVGRPFERCALVSIGSGVGVAELRAGTLVRRGGAGVLDHRTTVGRDGRDGGDGECTCGSRGCPAALLSPQALVRRYAELSGGSGVRAWDLPLLAARGDRPAARVWLDAVDALAEILAPVAARVGCLVIGGEAARAGRVILRPLGSALAERLPHRTRPELVVTGLGRGAASLGAALLAREARSVVSYAA